MTAIAIVDLVCSHRLRYTTETDLQDRLDALFASAGFTFEREERLTPEDRPDFMLGSIAVEVKIKGSKMSVISQLERYSQSERVSEIVLVTSKAVHSDMPATLNGKTVHVASLIAAGLY